MIDLAKLILIAGDGGHGRVSFRREKYIPKGGPDGGDGGDGGDIIVVGSEHYSTLSHIVNYKKFQATPGEMGGKRQMIGGRGEDIILEVPIGTVIWILAENKTSYLRRTATRTLLTSRKYEVEKIGAGVPHRSNDDMQPVEDKIQFAEITEVGQRVVVCQGGKGGRGNRRFATASHQTPLDAEYGTFGEQKEVLFEQKLLADVGLVGYPNAGKSTLLSVLTKARPKIANYPFTTIEPNMGIMSLDVDQTDESGRTTQKELVLADIPGLIEGASQGKGLGFEFLRHIEHCRLLAFILSLDEVTIFDEALAATQKAQLLWQQYQQLNTELDTYNPILTAKPRIIAVNKIDLYSPELIEEIKTIFAKHKTDMHFISAASQQGLDELKKAFAD